MGIFVTLRQTTFSIMVLSLMTVSLTTHTLTIKYATLSMMAPDTLMLSIGMLRGVCAECPK
jgi:hypothetical protein